MTTKTIIATAAGLAMAAGLAFAQTGTTTQPGTTDYTAWHYYDVHHLPPRRRPQARLDRLRPRRRPTTTTTPSGTTSQTERDWYNRNNGSAARWARAVRPIQP